MYSILNDIVNECLHKGVVPTIDDIQKISKIANGKLDAAGYHNIISDSIKAYYNNGKGKHEQLSLFTKKENKDKSVFADIFSQDCKS